MHKLLLDLLACPYCKNEIILSVSKGSIDFIEEGSFSCTLCNKIFPIVNNVPFFSATAKHQGIKNQQDTYSVWWDKFHNDDNIADEHNPDFLFNSLRIPAKDFENKIILDAGCGNGRFSYVVSRYKPKLLVAFDISTGLFQAQKAIQKSPGNKNVAFIQGDITNPPFRQESFDIVFSWGVIHHTPDTYKTFSGLSSLPAKNGTLGIYVYEFHPVYNYKNHWLILAAMIRARFLVLPLRYICSRLPVWVVRLIFQPVFYFEKMVGIGFVGCHADGPRHVKFNKKIYFSVVIDRYKSRYASEHQLQEVIGWFVKHGYNFLSIGKSPSVSISGKKTGIVNPVQVSLYQTIEHDSSNDSFLKS